MNSNLTLNNGDKVQTTWGNWYTVIAINGVTTNETTVYVTDTLQQTIHISKINKVVRA